MIFHLEWRCFQEVFVKSFALHRPFVWGMYRAELSRRDTTYYAKQMLAKADSLKGHASKDERLYIEASVAAEAAEKSDKKDNSKPVQIYRKLVKRSPHDMQARIFLA